MWYFIGGVAAGLVCGVFVGVFVGGFGCAIAILSEHVLAIKKHYEREAEVEAFCRKIIDLKELEGKAKANWLIEEARKILDGE